MRWGSKPRKAISPVTATVILVAVAIAVAVAVALWGAEITALFTKFEKAEFRLLLIKRTFHEDFFVALTLKNTGPTDITVENVLVNQKPFRDFGGSLRSSVQ